MADSLEERLAQFTVVTTAFEVERVDVMGGAERYSIDVDGQHGMVALVDVMPRLVPVGQTADFAIVQAARVSYGAGTKKVNEDEGLIRYLARHRHTTPFEHCELKFHVCVHMFHYFVHFVAVIEFSCSLLLFAICLCRLSCPFLSRDSCFATGLPMSTNIRLVIQLSKIDFIGRSARM
jgi:hypothetical protein